MGNPVFTHPDDQQLRHLLQGLRRIAVVGLSPNPGRPSWRVSRQMQAWGVQIVPVRPLVVHILGEQAYARLADVPPPIDLVNVFRNANEAEAIVEQAIAYGAPAIWFQQGIYHEAAALRAQQAGMLVVMDRCLMVEYARLVGGV